MWSPKRILVATDFSPCAAAAAEVGLELARALQVPLVLLHVYGVPGAPYEGFDTLVVEDYARSLENAARIALNNEAMTLRGKGVVVSTVLDRGTPWEQILEAAKNLEIGIIVVGTHGRRGLPRAILGSVAEKLARLSSVPVLTVHRESSAGEQTAAPAA